MSNETLFTAVDNYIGRLFASEDEALAAAVRDMDGAGMPMINVSPVLGKFLYVLAKLANAKRILEIGTLGGYSAIWLARALPEGGQLVSLEIDPLHAKVARRNIARAMLLGKAVVMEGPALGLLEQMSAEGVQPFDMVFIDADKESYAEYFHHSLKLVRRGGLIVADNVIRGGAIVDAQAADQDPRVMGVLRFAEAVARSAESEAIAIQTVGSKGHDGMALILKA